MQCPYGLSLRPSRCGRPPHQHYTPMPASVKMEWPESRHHVSVYPQDVTYRPRDRLRARSSARGIHWARHKICCGNILNPPNVALLARVLAPALSLSVFGCSLTDCPVAGERNGPQGVGNAFSKARHALESETPEQRQKRCCVYVRGIRLHIYVRVCMYVCVCMYLWLIQRLPPPPHTRGWVSPALAVGAKRPHRKGGLE